jgi:hypothetical protein
MFRYFTNGRNFVSSSGNPRLNLGRVPTMSSMASRASSWDFSATPYPSVRNSLISPSNSQYLANLPRSRTSSKIISPPPSPRVPLRQWAERTASEDGGTRHIGGETSRQRSASARGRTRWGPSALDVARNSELVVSPETITVEMPTPISPVFEATLSSSPPALDVEEAASRSSDHLTTLRTDSHTDDISLGNVKKGWLGRKSSNRRSKGEITTESGGIIGSLLRRHRK